MALIEGTDQMISNGWPLGLGNLSYRIRAVEHSAEQAVAPPQTHSTSRIPRSFSFSSLSSSNLDTESTASFFRDRSVSLGRLIGIKAAANKEKLVVDERLPAPFKEVSKSHESSRRICVPLLHCVIGRLTPSGRH